MPSPQARRRFGWVVALVTEVLEAAHGPMRARAIHEAAERLLGAPIPWTSVKTCLWEGSVKRPGRFERVSFGCYRLAR